MRGDGERGKGTRCGGVEGEGRDPICTGSKDGRSIEVRVEARG